LLGDINRNLEPIEYDLILCKPDKTQIGVLNAENISIDFRFPTTDELNFSVFYGENYYDLIKGDYLILLNNEKYFIIDNPEEVGNGTEVKNIHCYSLEYMLNKKNVRGYKLVSRKLYSLTDELDTDGFQLGVMNYVKTITSWKLDINSFTNFTGINSKYRSFDISEKSLFEFLINDVQKAYECIFLFDTLTKTISVKSIDDIQGNKGLYISEDNYIQSINKKIKNDEIKTRLYCYGNNISIAEINPTGMPYIENYTFYKTLEFMSQGLITALNAYEANLDFNSQTYADLLNDLDTLYGEFDILDNELTNSKTALTIVETSLDLAIKNNESLVQLNIDLTNAENNVASKQLLVDNKQLEIDAKYVEISDYNNSVKISNYLNTDALVEEFDFFIKQETWEDNNYVEATDLLDAGKKKLLKLSTPPLIFEIEVINFLNVVECQHDWEKLVLGDIVSIEFSKFDVDIEVRLVGYTHSPSENSLKLIFSNKDAIDDPFIYQTDLVSNAITSSTTLSYNKASWDNKANSSAITELRNENIDATLKQVLAGKNQSMIMNGRGLWLKEIDDSGNISPEQLRIINNAVVLTKDNFQTASTAISPNGINSGTLIGNSVIGVSGLFESLTVVDTGGQPIAKIGIYGDNKRGIQISNGNFEILPSTGVISNGVELGDTGLIISKTNGTTSLTHRTILNATDGFKFQKNSGTFSNPSWENVVYINADTGKLKLVDIEASGSIEASSLSATTKLLVNNINIVDLITNGLNALANANTINGGAIINGTLSASKIITSELEVGTNVAMGTVKAGKLQDFNGTKTVLDLSNGTMRFGTSDVDYKLKFDGTNLVFGTGSITWNNLDSTTQTNLVGPQGVTGSTGAQGVQGNTGATGAQGIPGVDANLLDWVSAWNGTKTLIGSDYVVTPKIFTGTTVGGITGVLMGNVNGFNGIAGYNAGTRTFSVDATTGLLTAIGATINGKFTINNSNNYEIFYARPYSDSTSGAIVDLKTSTGNLGIQLFSVGDGYSHEIRMYNSPTYYGMSLESGSNKGLKFYNSTGQTYIGGLGTYSDGSMYLQLKTPTSNQICSIDKDQAIFNTKVGIKNNSPVYDLDIIGDINFTGNLYQNGLLYTATAKFA